MLDSEARPWWRRWQRWLEAGFDILYPPRCAGCREAGTDWCQACEARLNRLVGHLCKRCGLPLKSVAGCPVCRSHVLPLVVRSYAKYEGVLTRALLQMKYRPNRRLAFVMGSWLAELCSREKWQPTLVVPVPLAKQRERRRGYNQASLIASALAEVLGLPLENNGLSRVRETRSQVGLDPVSRRRNVQNAFKARPGSIEGHAVLLVDDLFTTGATLSACAAALTDAGAREVFGVTVGRA